MTGLSGLALNARREWLDRSRLGVKADLLTDPDGSAALVFTVDNDGRQAVTVGMIGLEWRIDGLEEAEPSTGELIVNSPAARELIPAHGSTQITWPATTPLRVPCLDAPVRAFVQYRGTRRAYGKVHALFRGLDTLGWRPTPTVPDAQARERKGLVARPVVWPWKLWRRRDLRRPQPAPPEPFTREQMEAVRRELSGGQGT